MIDTSFWRTELWHPLTLHFPITLLLLATVAKLAGLFLREGVAFFWQRSGSYLLYAGCLAAWFSIYTGNLAEGIVARKICDPTVLKDHELSAYALAYIFSAGAVMDLGRNLPFLKGNSRFFQLLLVLLLLAGSVVLAYTGHLGAQVVYQQGGGVNMPASDCAGF
ncbi:DUF2231 domain-containing protein [Botryobacter ruber]|uniref:DUF2231 domain-containing protein n=1 Tax=Botryobacter ruber TaxID=2171629 RepID=UPI0013E3B2A3|nr:DUF2231 domain-containing protein [Botryobacter ruber]